MGEIRLISPKEMRTGSFIFHFGSMKFACVGWKVQKQQPQKTMVLRPCEGAVVNCGPSEWGWRELRGVGHGQGSERGSVIIYGAVNSAPGSAPPLTSIIPARLFLILLERVFSVCKQMKSILFFN